MARNFIPCSVLELVQFLLLIALPPFPVSKIKKKKGKCSQAVARTNYPQNVLGESLLAALETRSFWEMMLLVISKEVFSCIMRQCMAGMNPSCCTLMGEANWHVVCSAGWY